MGIYDCAQSQCQKDRNLSRLVFRGNKINFGDLSASGGSEAIGSMDGRGAETMVRGACIVSGGTTITSTSSRANIVLEETFPYLAQQT